jgi:Bacterial Ig-like domain
VRLRLAPIALACLALALPAAARAGTRHDEAVSVLEKVEAVRDGRGAKSGFELTPLLRELAARLPDLTPGERRSARRMMLRPTIGQAQPGEDAYAVPEAPASPSCSAHFCIHWVAINTSTHKDAPPPADSDSDGIPNYVETMTGVFEHVHQVENTDMGWREPVGDGSRGGGSDKTDVYIKQLGDQGIFGYSTPDPNQKGNSQFAYLVMDNDFSHSEFPRYTDPLEPMEVTAAHEYNHVIQFGYDWLQDTWMFESTAVWAEDKVYDDVNDYVSYLKRWSQLTQIPLTEFDATDPASAVNIKVYGDAVWERWIEAHYGQDVVRAAWEKSLDTEPPSFAPGAFDAALRTHGTSFFDAFTRFAADTAEWRSTAGPFEEGPTWPDVKRSAAKALVPGAGVAGHLDHTGYALVNVTPTKDAKVRFVGNLPHGVPGAYALVGRQGSETAGSIDIKLKRVPNGGRGHVTLTNPAGYSRITAVLVNAGVTQDGFRPEIGDWDFRRVDDRSVTGLLTTDLHAPRVLSRTPGSSAKGVSRDAKVGIRFSEPVTGVNTSSVRLIEPGGHKIGARVSYDRHSRKARLTPKEELDPHTRYLVKLTARIVDRGQNTIAPGGRTWHFSTGG